MTCEAKIMLFEATILFLTLLAATYYAYVTKKLWGESIKQTRLLLRPIVVISYDEVDDEFKYINYGNSPAFQIRIDDITLIDTAGLRFDYVFSEVYALPQSKQIKVENIKKKLNDDISEADNFDLGSLIPFSAHRSFNILIRYKSAENEDFVTKGRLGQGTFDIRSIERLS